MAKRRTAAVAFALLALLCVTGGCSASSPESNTASTASFSSGESSHPRTLSIVALGDSVPRGTSCHCTPYPRLSADGLTARTGYTVKATNDSVAGATTPVDAEHNTVRHRDTRSDWNARIAS